MENIADKILTVGMENDEDYINILIQEAIESIMRHNVETIAENRHIAIYVDRFRENNQGNIIPEIPIEEIVINQVRPDDIGALEMEDNIEVPVDRLQPQLLKGEALKQFVYLMEVAPKYADCDDLRKFYIPIRATFADLACTIRYKMGLTHRQFEHFETKDPSDGRTSIIASEMYRFAIDCAPSLNYYPAHLQVIHKFFIEANPRVNYFVASNPDEGGNYEDRKDRQMNVYNVEYHEIFIQPNNRIERERVIDEERYIQYF